MRDANRPNRDSRTGAATRRVTLSDIAKAVNLSSAAVSMALRGSGGVSERTREQVFEAAERLGYVYDRGAATLRTGQSDTIGLIVGDVSNAFFGDLALGVDLAVAEAGKISFLLNTREQAERQDSLLRRLREQGVDGVILCPAPGTQGGALARLAGSGVPMVQMLRYVEDFDGDLVRVDYRAGVRALVDHLAGLGHRRIAFVGGEYEHSATRERLEGFRAAMRHHGLPADLVRRTALSRRAGREAIGALLAAEDPPTAALCYNDIVAFGVIVGLRALGRRPGHDLAVTGFDDVEEAAESWPPLTTVATRPRQIGREAGRLLLARLAEPDRPTERVTLTPEPVIRQSCREPPA